MSVEVGAFGEVLAEETVGVLVGSALPWTLGVAEVDVEVGVCAELGVLGHFDSLVPGQRAAELLGQGGDRRSDSVSYGLGAGVGVMHQPLVGIGCVGSPGPECLLERVESQVGSQTSSTLANRRRTGNRRRSPTPHRRTQTRWEHR